MCCDVAMGKVLTTGMSWRRGHSACRLIGPNSKSLFAVAPVSTECRPKCALGGSHIDTSSFVAGHFRAMLIGIAAITRSCKRDFRRQAVCARPTIGEVLLPEELGACKKRHLAAD